MISENLKLVRFDEKVSKILREYEKKQKREELLIELEVKREDPERR